MWKEEDGLKWGLSMDDAEGCEEKQTQEYKKRV